MKLPKTIIYTSSLFLINICSLALLSAAVTIPDFEKSMRCYTFPHYKDTNWDLAKELYYQNHFLKSSPLALYKIPKIIHHIWLGGSVPERFMDLIKSWDEHHAHTNGWMHIIWTDKDVAHLTLINQNLFNKAHNKGLKSDVLRYELLYRFGGFYADIDLECVKSLDILHQRYTFFASFFPHQSIVANGIIGAAPGHPILKSCIDNLKNVSVNESNPDDIQEKVGPRYFTKQVFAHAVKKSNDLIIFPASYFFAYPVDLRTKLWKDKNIYNARKKYLTPEAFALHLWANSWLEEKRNA